MYLHPHEAEGIRIARAFVEKERAELYREREPADTNAVVIEAMEYCQFGDDCKHPSGCQQMHSSRRACSAEVKRRGGSTKRKCNFQVNDELVIDELSCSEIFIVQARHENQRDLLLFPNTEKLHLANTDMVAWPVFWQHVQMAGETVIKLMDGKLCNSPFERVAFNFGLWETAMSLDHRAIDCHAHAHLHLTRECAEFLQNRWPMLVGRINAPERYREKNCIELENRRLLSKEMREVSNKLTDLSATVNTMSNNMTALMAMVSRLLSDGSMPAPVQHK